MVSICTYSWAPGGLNDGAAAFNDVEAVDWESNFSVALFRKAQARSLAVEQQDP